MKIRYLVEITDPQTHLVKVTLHGKKAQITDKMEFFLPSWSPGSYLMREYSRNIRYFSAFNKNGEHLYYKQTAKGIWEVDWSRSDTKTSSDEFTVTYEIYCHELTVRTSHVDQSHAFLHGPSFLMGIMNESLIDPEIELKFPAIWSKLHTGLKDISKQRERFIYTAQNYDELIDSPIEIGCHESDGFMHEQKEHHVIFYGEQYPHPYDLKKDIKKIVETVSSHFSDIPYESYLFITHFVKGKYGGLEHHNSTALQFDGRKLKNRNDYINWLALVAHEYFHTWNVKRIRPVELGPFDYTSENYTRMHWLTEGLTSFMDELLVLRSGLISLTEYLEMQKKNLKRYYSIPGKKFHSLEDGSFNAWIKLYRPDENTNNSSISYYLKGGLVFSTLHFDLIKKGKSINDFLDLLWKRYKLNPDVGITKCEVLSMIEDLSDKELAERFDMRLTTIEDIDFETYYRDFGMEFIWEESEAPELGVDFLYKQNRVYIDKVTLDGPAFKAGLNAGDEIIAINRQRFLKNDASQINTLLTAGLNYTFTVSRLDVLYDIVVNVGRKSRSLRQIVVTDEQKAREAFS